MVIFNSYVSLPEGITSESGQSLALLIHQQFPMALLMGQVLKLDNFQATDFDPLWSLGFCWWDLQYLGKQYLKWPVLQLYNVHIYIYIYIYYVYKYFIIYIYILIYISYNTILLSNLSRASHFV